MGFSPYNEKRIVGYEGADSTGTAVGSGLAGASSVGLGITAATGGMDLGAAAIIGSGISLLAPFIGSMFDEPAEPIYEEIPDDPIMQLPSPRPLSSSRGISVMGEQPMAPQYGLENLMGFYE
jgi:hypothetical protein|tara:strand:+ start:541 stop:906 length:366 start_codon:yes stop_codon:yes gene_type:complete